MAHNILFYIVSFLGAALVCVPISKRLGFGSVLGYLLAGVITGPFGFALFEGVEDLMHMSEFGVVFLMFLIGLELEPKKLWEMRVSIFGLGSLQVLLVGFLVFLIAYFLYSQTASVSILVGMSMALSSTAMALQILNERRLLNTHSGRSAFSILLFQDIAVIAMIAILPLLAINEAGGSAENSSGSWLHFAKVAGTLIVAIVGGRLLLRPLLRRIASLHLREIFTAFALFLVVGMSYIMQQLDISMALGAFMAGVLLADSEYRHALESDIEPFKGLLMGLFFMTVGMSIDFSQVFQRPLFFGGMVVALFATKIFAHVVLGRLFKIPRRHVPFFAVVLSQVGEFAFVLLGAAAGLKIIDFATNQALMALVALTMLMTPILVLAYEKIYVRFFDCANTSIDPDIEEPEDAPVIIAGFGRFGQIVGRLLYANRVKAVVMDYEPTQIELLRRFGFKVRYGDATRLDLLEAAGARTAQILVVAIDDTEASLKLVDIAKENFPHLKIFVRARNMAHVYALMDRKVEVIERELFESSLRLGASVLKSLGWPAYRSVQAAHIFRDHNVHMIQDLYERRDNQDEMVAKAKQARDDLEKMFIKENEYLNQAESWDSERHEII